MKKIRLSFVFILTLASTFFLVSCKTYTDTEMAIMNGIRAYSEQKLSAKFDAIYTNKNGYSTEVMVYNAGLLSYDYQIEIEKAETKNVYNVTGQYSNGDWNGELEFTVTCKNKQVTDVQLKTPIIANSYNLYPSVPDFIELMRQDALPYVDANNELTTVPINEDTVMAFDDLRFIPNREDSQNSRGDTYEIYSLDIYLKDGRVLNGKIYTRYLPSIQEIQEVQENENIQITSLWEKFQPIDTFTLAHTFDPALLDEN